MKSAAPRKTSPSKEPSSHPEYVVRKEVLIRYFKPAISDSTFYELVNKGLIVPFKNLRGYFKLNESLRRMGLKEVARLPEEPPSRSTEEIIRFAFSVIDPEVFAPPSWLLDVEVIDARDADHAIRIIQDHRAEVEQLSGFALKHGYLQGVLDADYMQSQDLRDEPD